MRTPARGPEREVLKRRRSWKLSLFSMLLSKYGDNMGKQGGFQGFFVQEFLRIASFNSVLRISFTLFLTILLMIWSVLNYLARFSAFQILFFYSKGSSS
jgi:hypothetical protein